MKFQIIKNDKVQHSAKDFYSWRLLADDGRVIARSRRYKSLSECRHDVHYVAISAVSLSLDYLLEDDSLDPIDPADNPFATPIFTDPRSPLNDPLDRPLDTPFEVSLGSSPLVSAPSF